MKEYIEVTDKKSPVKSQEIDAQKRIQAVKVLDDLWHEPRYYGVFEDANNYYSTIKAFDAPLKACNEARKQKKNVDQSIKTSKPKKRFIKKTDAPAKTRTKVTRKKFELLTDFEVRQSKCLTNSRQRRGAVRRNHWLAVRRHPHRHRPLPTRG